MMLGKIPEKGNAPLFYLIQKGVCQLSGYKFPFTMDGEWEVADPRSQIILRFSSNIFMSLAVVLIFYYFLRFYSLGAGIYSLFFSLSSYMVWAYWVEARPYSLWFLLTTIQALSFLHIIRQKKMEEKHWLKLSLIHWVLAFAAVASLMQILIVSFLIWIFKKERKWQRYLVLAILPTVICIFYNTQSPQFKFWYTKSWMDLVYAAFSLPRMFMIGLLGCFVIYKNHERLENKSFLTLTTLMVLSGLALLVFFKIANTGGPQGFEISSRYFIYLTPLSIIAATIFVAQLFQTFSKNKFALAAIVVIVALVLKFDYDQVRGNLWAGRWMPSLTTNPTQVQAAAYATNLDHLTPQYPQMVDFIEGKRTLDQETLTHYKKYYAKIAEYSPTHADAYGLWGYFSYRLNDYDQAIAAYQKAIELNPHFLWFYYNLGLLHFKKGDYKTTVELLNTALKTRTDFSLMFIDSSNQIYKPIIGERVNSSNFSLEKQFRQGKCNSLVILAFIYKTLGEDGVSIKLLEKAEQLSQVDGFPVPKISDIDLESY